MGAARLARPGGIRQGHEPRVGRDRGGAWLRPGAGARRLRRSGARPAGPARDGRHSGAQEAGTALAMSIDEMQHAKEEELAALIAAMHRCAPRRLPVTLVGAGLARLPGRMRSAKSCAERRFDFPEVGPLDTPAARIAIVKPAEAQGVAVTTAALEEIVRQTRGCPYFLQERGRHTRGRRGVAHHRHRRRPSPRSRTASCGLASIGSPRASSVTCVRWRNWAQGPHRCGDIAHCLHRPVTALGPTRGRLIARGHDLEPEPRRDGFRGGAARRVHAPPDAGAGPAPAGVISCSPPGAPDTARCGCPARPPPVRVYPPPPPARRPRRPRGPGRSPSRRS
jgi:hypothetical protein